MMRELNNREKMAVSIAGLFILATLLIFGVINPFKNSLEKMDRRIASKQKQVAALEEQFREYRQLKAESSRIEQRSRKAGQVSLISFVESTATKIAARDKLVYLRPQPVKTNNESIREVVEVKLERIRLDQLVKLLYEVETSTGLLQATQLRIKTRFDDPAQLDTVMTLVNYGGGGR